jgi:hypothetical protein
VREREREREIELCVCACEKETLGWVTLRYGRSIRPFYMEQGFLAVWFASRFSPSEVDREREVEQATNGLLRGLVGCFIVQALLLRSRNRCIVQHNNTMVYYDKIV